jgi:hypothetical protein
MALFGLSPLFLSVIASNFFTDPDAGLNVPQFLRFLSIFVGSVHLIGAFYIKTPLAPGLSSARTEQASSADERSPLLPATPHVSVDVLTPGSALDLLRDPSFWSLALVVLVTLGSVRLTSLSWNCCTTNMSYVV